MGSRSGYSVDTSVTLGAGVGFTGAGGVPANTATIGSPGGISHNQYSDASLAEIIVYDRVLTSAERVSVWDHLTAKWGVAP